MKNCRSVARIQLLSLLACAAPQTGVAAFVVPERWWGDLGYTYREARNFESDSTIMYHQVTGTLNTSAYIWQPWFANAGATVAVTQSEEDHNGTGVSNDIVTGRAFLNILPRSQVPFALNYQVSDSSVSSEGIPSLVPGSILYTDQHLRRRNLMVSQGYYQSNFRINARYNLDISETEHEGTYTTETYGADYSLRLPHQELLAQASQQDKTHSDSADTARNQRASLEHRYHPRETINVNSLVSHIQQHDEYIPTGGTTLLETVTTNDQATSTLNWRTQDRKLLVNGGFRAYQTETDYASNLVEQQGMSLNARGIYRFTRNVWASAGAQENVLRRDGVETRSSIRQAGLGYNSDTHRVWNFDYSWHSSAEVANQRDETDENQLTTLTVGHGAARHWALENRGNLRLTLNQAVSHRTVTDETGDGGQLSHGLSLGWNQNHGGGDSLLQLTFSDIRGIGVNDYESQLLNLQAARNQILDQRSSLRGSFTAQFSRQRLQGLDDSGFNRSLVANAIYRLDRPFGVQRISFLSDFKAIDNKPLAARSRRELLWENRLLHQIGKLHSTLTLRLQHADDQLNSLLILQVKRTF